MPAVKDNHTFRCSLGCYPSSKGYVVNGRFCFYDGSYEQVIQEEIRGDYWYYHERERIQSYSNVFYKWPDWPGWPESWSEWSTTVVSDGISTSGSLPNQTQTERIVETRKQYSYKQKP